VPGRWKRADRGDALALLATWQWSLRAAVFVLVAAIVLSGNEAVPAGIVELAIAAAALISWWASGRLPEPWAGRSLLACLAVTTAVGGFAAASDHNTAVLGLAIISMLSAGVELSFSELLVVLLAGVLAVEIGAIIYGNTDLGTVLGYPALLAGLAVTGRYRRAYRIQTEQAKELVAETRHAQAEAERAAALTERSRIAREIHDVLAHSLGALGIQIQAAEAMLSERHDIDSALRSLSNAHRLVDVGLTETRRAVHALRTDAPPLPQALAALVSDGAGQLSVSGEPRPLSPAAGLALLRTAQEAVTNARKYAHGNPVSIALSYSDAVVELRIENELAADGDTPSDATGGYGLAGMHERLRLIDGDLTAGPVDGRWVVRATVAQ
jgi:signal transduction histidine kinase